MAEAWSENMLISEGAFYLLNFTAGVGGARAGSGSRYKEWNKTSLRAPPLYFLYLAPGPRGAKFYLFNLLIFDFSLGGVAAGRKHKRHKSAIIISVFTFPAFLLKKTSGFLSCIIFTTCLLGTWVEPTTSCKLAD
jgi:hypothetical protein